MKNLSLEHFLIHPDRWEAVCADVAKEVRDAGKSGPAGLGFHPELGLFILLSGQGPYIAWHQRGDASKWTGKEPAARVPWNGTFHTDDHFSIGSSHTVCQDYTRSVDGEGKRACAFVSDGCSSSPDSDFGSRFAVMSAIWETMNASTIPLDPRRIASGAEIIGHGLLQTVLGRTCLDATLLAAVVRDDGLVQVQAFGDGAIIVRRRNGSVEIYDIDHDSTPAYPSHLVNGVADRYMDEMAGRLTVKVSVDGCFVATWDLLPKTDQEGVRAAWPELSFTVDPADTDLVVVATDGVHSFQDVSGLSPVPIPLESIIPHLVGFKNMAGAFVGRRLHAFETKECPKRNWRHYDDLGVAALWMEEKEAPETR